MLERVVGAGAARGAARLAARGAGGGEKVSARPQKPRLGRFTQGVSATISILATD